MLHIVGKVEIFKELVERHISSQDVINQLLNLFVFRGIPEHIRSDNGPEFTSRRLDQWAYLNGIKLDFSRPVKPNLVTTRKMSNFLL